MSSAIPARTARTLRAAAIPLAALFALAACAGEPAPVEPATASEAVTITDAWVKAAEIDDHMTSGFGLLDNASSADVALVSATSPAAEMVELHEITPDGMMREVDGGFALPAGDVFVMEPGGYHLMLMGITEPLFAGQTVAFTLLFDDGSELNIEAIVKDFTGAHEKYEHDHGDHDHEHGDDHDHDDDGHGDH